jgi:phospholipid/cholesterol/gamma-HCH transport system substrate-binding protein
MKLLDAEYGEARLARILLFFAVGVVVVVYLLVGTPLKIPFLKPPMNYVVKVNVPDVDNAIPGGEVRIAGIKVGQIDDIQLLGGQALLTLSFTPDGAPLHQGATGRVGAKSVVEETDINIRDGSGPAIPSGTTLPDGSVKTSVQVRDIVNSLDAPSRENLGATLRSLGAGTDGTSSQVRQTLDGLGDLGREGYTALDAFAAQSQDLKLLTRDTATVLKALDAGQGTVVNLVTSARQLTSATDRQHSTIEDTMGLLPPVLDSANTASVSLTGLASALAPVSAGLNSAGRPLGDALTTLPDTTRDVRHLLPSLSTVLDRAPTTLHKESRLGSDIRDAVPDTREILREVNPMVAYLKPYGHDFAAWITNFNAILQATDERGYNMARLQPMINDASVATPVDPSRMGIGAYNNAIPPAGKGGFPGPFKGNYPHVVPDPY